jgi:RHS repeat-associated protein
MLGTPAIQTDENGAVYNRQSSTPYGIRTGHEGRSSDEFKFTDKEWDDDLDLVYFGARYYDPELGTWLSVDPLV